MRPWGTAALFALMLFTMPIAAQPVPDSPAPVTTAEVPDATGAADHPFQLGNVGRPVFFGLIAASFLAMCAILAGRGKVPRSRRPPPR
jgi:hypothetical protein